MTISIEGPQATICWGRYIVAWNQSFKKRVLYVLKLGGRKQTFRGRHPDFLGLLQETLFAGVLHTTNSSVNGYRTGVYLYWSTVCMYPGYFVFRFNSSVSWRMCPSKNSILSSFLACIRCREQILPTRSVFSESRSCNIPGCTTATAGVADKAS